MKRFLFPAIIAIIISVTLRLTLLTEDCNLFIMGLTFLLSFVVAWLAIYLVNTATKRR